MAERAPPREEMKRVRSILGVCVSHEPSVGYGEREGVACEHRGSRERRERWGFHFDHGFGYHWLWLVTPGLHGHV